MQALPEALAGLVLCGFGGCRLAQSSVDDLAATPYLHQHYAAAGFGMEQLHVELQIGQLLLQPDFLE